MFALNNTQLSRVAASAQKRAGVRASAGNTVSSRSKQAKDEVREYVLTLPGITAPFENVFDPLNFIDRAANVDEMKRWREAEITHCRVAMLAALGFVVGEQLEDFPAFLNYDGGISGVPAIYQFQKVEEVRPLFWESLVLAIGLAETSRVAMGWANPRGTGFNSLKEDYTPGDLGFDPLGMLPTDADELKTLQDKELNNGRLAMIGIAGFVAQELVVNREIFEHLALYLEDAIIEDIIDPIEEDLIKGGVNVPITPIVPIPKN